MTLTVQRILKANENICHGNRSKAIEICYDLLLQPNLNPMLRASVNTCIAIHADFGRHPDKMKWIIEARQILHELKDWATDSKSQEQLAFVEERINGAERIVKKQVEAKEQAENTKSTGTSCG
ncbi:hypothetical protein LTR47_004436 [Exophiala xenobiotica]|nr:hypothetical protein LTR92_003786 [Exophiala xenobiotica]KAK5214338.1 hypothetical protein LTR41_000531 [Exophiala xenobiotica]KAK5234403.1 hypothetical protein LTR47_004436 [Exophiala xenobiotica]KAK5254876.1 hypothetical protein LTS06_001015 [Exophiala xenobiotica]KAK5352236.1 hypothetical protein LTR61_004487 [Exophiala xenobiotica]